jgi:hypothetical protein
MDMKKAESNKPKGNGTNLKKSAKGILRPKPQYNPSIVNGPRKASKTIMLCGVT